MLQSVCARCARVCFKYVSNLLISSRAIVSKSQDITKFSRLQCVKFIIPQSNDPTLLQVGDFKNLLKTIKGDSTLIRKLRDILKILDEGRWQELVHTVESSVLVDNRVRAFMCPAPSGQLLLLFPCNQGRIDFRTPIGLYCPQGPDNPSYVYVVASYMPFFAVTTTSGRSAETAMTDGTVSLWLHCRRQCAVVAGKALFY
jgi:hypothetical protein